LEEQQTGLEDMARDVERKPKMLGEKSENSFQNKVVIKR
jgi:hypothetical protein